jgi:ABC-2 type transport system ATP-binding protein
VTFAIETHGLTKEFRGGRGVRDVHLKIEQGQVFGFLGPNGAGKSTFVKMLVGLLHPTSGEAHVLGLPAGDVRVRRRIGYLPELFRYQEWLSAEEVLRFHARLCKLDAQYAKDRVRTVLEDVGLSGREHERVRHYSKGMQQRLGIACALLPEPEVLFLDEPASALDPGGRHEVRELLTHLAANGMTVFLNTHLLEDVESICSDVALLIDGTIRARGSVDEILHPEPLWDFTVEGWTPQVLQDLSGVLEYGLGLTVKKEDGTGFAVIEVKAANKEQVAWLNDELVRSGVSVYAIEPRTNRLESWFLARTEARGGNGR